ncbi:MAG: Sel1-like repeat-containing protein kinase family protein [Parachlamydiaceae bacterium]
MSPLGVIKDIVGIGRAIHSQVQLAKRNQKQLETLGKTVQATVSTLEGLADLPKTQNFIQALTELQSRIQETSGVVQEIVQMSSMMGFLNAGKNQTRIDECRKSIQECLVSLNVGLSAQQLIGENQDRPDEGKASLFLPDTLILNLDDIVFEQKIKDDDCGSLYQGVWQERRVWIKCLDGIATEVDRLQLTREAHVMSRLHHSAIVEFYGACLGPEKVCLLTEIMEKGELTMSLSSLAFSDRLQMAKDLSCALAYLHRQEIILGDIHPRHVGVNEHNRAKWKDFSLAKSINPGIATLKKTSDEAAWQAPESWLNREALTRASDIYSFGMLIWSLVTGRSPFENVSVVQVMQKVQRGEREVMSRDIPPSCRELITACWSTHPLNRPTASQVAQVLHSFDDSLFCFGQEDYELGVAAEKAGEMARAYQFYLRSSEQGYFKSFTSLGLFFLQGLGGQQVDKVKAQDYLERAAAGGHGRAMFNLGKMMEKEGNGAQALIWYEKAFEADPKDLRAKNKVQKLKGDKGG